MVGANYKGRMYIADKETEPDFQHVMEIGSSPFVKNKTKKKPDTRPAKILAKILAKDHTSEKKMT